MQFKFIKEANIKILSILVKKNKNIVNEVK